MASEDMCAEDESTSSTTLSEFMEVSMSMIEDTKTQETTSDITELKLWKVKRLLIELCMDLAHASWEELGKSLDIPKNVKRVGVFLAAYALILSPSDLIYGISACYLSPKAPGKLKEALRILLVVWIETRPYDFQEQNAKNTAKFLLQRFEIELRSKALYKRWSKKSLVESLAHYNKDVHISPEIQGRYEPLILKYRAVEIARSMTVMEWRSLAAVHQNEFLSLMWSHPTKSQTHTPNLLQFIVRNDTIKDWVATQIVRTGNLTVRVRVLSKFIRVAHKLVMLNNFSSASQIVSGIDHYTCRRLKHTIEKLSPKTLLIYEKLIELFDVTGNFSNYRKRLERLLPTEISRAPSGLPFLPYLAVHLKDLTFIAEGNTDEVQQDDVDTSRPQDTVLSYQKIMMMGQQITMICLSQQRSYDIDTNVALDDYLSSSFMATLSREDLEARSKVIEPADKEDTTRRHHQNTYGTCGKKQRSMLDIVAIMSPRLSRGLSDANLSERVITPPTVRRLSRRKKVGSARFSLSDSFNALPLTRDELRLEKEHLLGHVHIIRIEIPGTGEFKSFAIRQETLVREVIAMMYRKLSANSDDTSVLRNTERQYADYCLYVVERGENIETPLHHTDQIWVHRERTIRFMNHAGGNKAYGAPPSPLRADLKIDIEAVKHAID